MANTTNFGWETPDDTDLVKDGALAMRTLGNAIDTSLVDLKGGTTGQNLRKNTNTDMDFVWAGDATNTVIDAEGDLLVGDSADTLQRLAIGTTGQVLTVDTTIDGKIKWAAPSSGSYVKVAGTTFSAVSSFSAPNSIFTSTYKLYKIFVVITSASDTGTITLKGRVGGSDSNGNWYGVNFGYSTTTTTRNTADSGATAKNLSYVLNAAYLQNTLDFTWSNPQQATRSQIVGTSFTFDDAGAGAGTTRVLGGWDLNSTQYDSFSIITSAGNITGYYSVYGLEV